LYALAQKEDDLTCTHSIDAADENHRIKLEGYRTKKHYINAYKQKNKGK